MDGDLMFQPFILEEIMPGKRKDISKNSIDINSYIIQVLKRGRRRGLALIKFEEAINDECILHLFKKMFNTSSLKNFNHLNHLDNHSVEKLTMNRVNLEYVNNTEETIDFCFSFFYSRPTDSNDESNVSNIKMYYWVTIDKSNSLMYFRFKRNDRPADWRVASETSILNNLLSILKQRINIKPLPFEKGIFEIYHDLVKETEISIQDEIKPFLHLTNAYQNSLTEHGFLNPNTAICEEHLERLKDLLERAAIKKKEIHYFSHKTTDFNLYLRKLIYKDKYSGVNASEDADQKKADKDIDTNIFLDIRKTLNNKKELQEILVGCSFLKNIAIEDATDFSEDDKKIGVRIINKKDYLLINFNNLYLTSNVEEVTFKYFTEKFKELNLKFIN